MQHGKRNSQADAMAPVVELKNIRTPSSPGTPPLNATLTGHDVCALETDSPEEAHLLLKMLATLVFPAGGQYVFKGRTLDFSDYRGLLAIKKRIAYIAPDAALIGNRNIRDNLLLMRHYYENDLSIELDPDTMELCRILGMDNKLTLLPSNLHPLDVQRVITIRELTKSPEIILLERPEDFIWRTGSHQLHPALKRLLINNVVPMVFFSYDLDFVDEYATRIFSIRKGEMRDRDQRSTERT